MLPRFMLRPTAPKKPVPLKENMLERICFPRSSSAETYMIPALEMKSVTIQVKMWNKQCG